MTQPHPEPKVFDSLSNRGLRGYAAAGAGLTLVTVATVGFFLSLRTTPGLAAFHSMTTMPMILAVGLFASAYTTLRSPTRVVVGDTELTVMRGQSRVGRWRWEEIAHAAAAQTAMSHKRALKLYGQSGKLLVTLTDDLSDFDAMSNEIKHQMAQHPSAQRATVAHGKMRRRGAGLMVAGVLFFALAISNGGMATSDRRAAELLQTQGQPAQAIIIRKFTAPNGHTRRIEYKVDAPGAPTENVEVTPLLWALLQPNQRIDVIAVPGHPDVSHLRTGQVDEKMTGDPRVMLIASAVIALLSIVSFIAGILNWRGLELKWDRQRNRPHLVSAAQPEPSPENSPK
ncbi:MAG: hypothetical protein JWN40_613 [Phycisphaerales bacterium]|nr:hypothetical protein [Phycisphaerales bacterium]